MAEQIQAIPIPFDYELYSGDPDQLTTVDSTPPPPNSYINPESLKLKYRIGHGLFGDVWVATHHQSGKDYDEYHEVAVKMLHSINEDHVHEFLHKFEEVWRNLRSKQLKGVCWLHGISIVTGKICLVFKSYEGSVGDRIAHSDGGKLTLTDVLRYGIELAKGIQKLHQVGLLVLNLKPSNFLLDENDHIVLGDFGIPYLLLGIPWSDPRLATRLGTPNFMAPEQWEPEVRGPISYETDSWGFACSLTEMLTGAPPWFGRSTEEIHRAVVIRREKPCVPTGLPPALEDVLKGCFEYDFRNRPLITDILHALESSRKAVYSDGSWSDQLSNLYVNKPRFESYSTWFLSKDHIQIGDTVRSRKDPNKPLNLPITEGVVVGPEKETGFAQVKIPTARNQLRLNVSTLQRVVLGFASGDWVRLVKKTNEKNHSSLGVLHCVDRDGVASVGFLGMEMLWRGKLSELKLVESFCVGEFVRLRASVVTPQFEWPHKRGAFWASGKISDILPNGCLEVRFPGMFVVGIERARFLANPDEVERVSLETCRGILEKYEFVEDFHWAVKPIAIALGLVVVTKVGTVVGRNVHAGRRRRSEAKNEAQNQEDKRRGKSRWLPPKVAKIIFKEGTPIANSV